MTISGGMEVEHWFEMGVRKYSLENSNLQFSVGGGTIFSFVCCCMTILRLSYWYIWIICITIFWFILWWLWRTFCIDVFLLIGRGLWCYFDFIRACIIVFFDGCSHRATIISRSLAVFISMNVIITIFFQDRFDEIVCSNIFIAIVSAWSVWLSWCFICLRFVRNTVMIIIWNWIRCKLMKFFVRFKSSQLCHKHQY